MKKTAKADPKETAPSPRAAFIKDKWQWAAVFAGLFALHVTAASSEIGGNLGGDSVVYYFLAKAMATGQGYADLYLPGAPPHTKFPFMFPLILAPFHLLFERPLYAMHVMAALLNSAQAVILGAFAATRTGRRTGIVFAVLFGTMPVIYLQSLFLLSEPLYMMLAFAALLVIEKDSPAAKGQGMSIKGIAIISVLAVLAFFTRSAGVALVAALAAALLRRKSKLYIKGRVLPAWLVFILVAALLSVPWIARNHVAAGESSDYIGQFLAKDPYNTEAGTIGALDLGERLLSNTGLYLPEMTAGSFSPVWAINALQAAWPLVIALLVAGFIRELRRGSTAAELFTIFSICIVLLWPFHEMRFLVPVIPLSCFYLVRGITWLPERLMSMKRAGYVFAGAASLLMVFQLYSVSLLVKQRFEPQWMPISTVVIQTDDAKHEWRRPVINWAKYRFPPQWSNEQIRNMKIAFTDYIVMNKMLGKLTPQDAVILSRKPMLTYFYSGRKAVPLHWSRNPVEQRNHILQKDVDYIVMGLGESTLRRILRDDKTKGAFEKVAEVRGGISRLLKVNKDKPAGR